MALSDDERRVLEEMERHLRASTSDVMDITPRRRIDATMVTVGVLMIVAGIGILLSGIINRFPPLGIVGFVVMVVGVLISTTRRGKSESARPSPSAPRPSKPSTFEARWDRRMGGDS
ncbi:MAG: hypothetical protein RJA31_36 [Actinomycetota bacterium]|jgi:hypothetical protein